MSGFVKVIGAGLCAAAVLAGCSASNDGGDTTCGKFNKLDEEGQSAAVSKMLKDQKGEEPSNLEVGATRLSAAAFCKTLGKDSSKIKDIDTG